MRRTFWSQVLLGVLALFVAPAAWASSHALELAQFGPIGWLAMEYHHAMYHLMRYNEAFVVMVSGQWAHGWYLMNQEAVCATATPVTGALLGNPVGFLATVSCISAASIVVPVRLARRYKQRWCRSPGGQGARSVAHA